MAKSERKRPLEPTSYQVPVDAWTLNCLYNRSDYGDRIAAKEFVELFRETGRPKPDGERTVQVYYGRSDDRLERVRLQWFEDASGAITRSGLKQPIVYGPIS